MRISCLYGTEMDPILIKIQLHTDNEFLVNLMSKSLFRPNKPIER